jgi:hypothetical protein
MSHEQRCHAAPCRKFAPVTGHIDLCRNAEYIKHVTVTGGCRIDRNATVKSLAISERYTRRLRARCTALLRFHFVRSLVKNGIAEAVENHTVMSDDQPPLTRSNGHLCSFVSLSDRTHINTVDRCLTTSVAYTRTEVSVDSCTFRIVCCSIFSSILGTVHIES